MEVISVRCDLVFVFYFGGWWLVFIQKLYKIAPKYFEQGGLYEEDFDNCKDENGNILFPEDEDKRGKKKRKRFTDSQYHLMRTMILNHRFWNQKEKDARMKEFNQTIENVTKKYNDALDMFDLNEQLNGKDLSTKANFTKYTRKHLAAYIAVRQFSDVYDGLDLKKRNKDFLVNKAWDLHNTDVIAERPNEPVFTEHDQMPNSIPEIDIIHLRGDHSFNPDETWFEEVHNNIRNDTSAIVIDDMHLLDSTLSKVLARRLWNHLGKYKGMKGMEPSATHWQFMFQNFPRMAVILKLLGIVPYDRRRLELMRADEAMLTTEFERNHELLQEQQAIEHGCYLVFDKVRGRFIRAGSASNKFGHQDAVRERKGRINQHISASLKPKESNSKFYHAYPSQKADNIVEELKKGHFEDLEFVPIIRFADENKVDIQNLFVWNEALINRFKKRRNDKDISVQENKHRMICYLFETTMQMCLSLSDNISQNPGCEAFTGVWDRGFEDVDVANFT